MGGARFPITGEPAVHKKVFKRGTMSSFSIPLTGLQADEEALDTISNNLANMNTTGYKDQTANFSSLFYQNLGESGNGDPLQQGLGVQVSSTSTNFTAGSITSTGVSSDMAINGNGFFTVEDPTTGQKLLTQDGSFTTNSSGDLVTSNGLLVLGYPTENGVVNPNGALAPIVVPLNGSQSPQATQNVTVNANLDASATAGTVVTSSPNLFDSLGGPQDATITYTAQGGGKWSYAVTVPGAIGNAASTGTLQFNSSGQLVSPSTNIAGISFTGLAATGAAIGGAAITAGAAGAGATATFTVASGDAISGSLNLQVQSNTTLTNPTPTTPTSTAGSSATFTLSSSSDTLSGPITIASPGVTGSPVTATIPPSSSLSAAVASLNTQFGADGLTASASGNSLVITGPAGAANTMTLTGTLVDTPLATSVTSTFAAGTSVQDAVDQLNGQASFLASGLTASVQGGQLVITGPAGANNSVTATGTTLTQTAPGTTLTDGASPLNFALNLFGANGISTITQTASISTTTGTVADGNASGTFQSFSVNTQGVIAATYSNGNTAPLGQLAISSVSNEEGLVAVGGNDYQTTLASGQASVGAAGTGTLGTIEGGDLEASNVDISTEFANLIVAQNAFDANSKSVTTFDTVEQDTLNMMR
jgi:flagellar hook protein FlgE